MPYKCQQIKIANTEHDRRIKLTDIQRSEILELRKNGLSYKVIADRYNVSKTLVIYVCNPDIKERKRLQFIARKREGRYKPTREEWNETQREHRRYKQKLYVEGKIS